MLSPSVDHLPFMFDGADVSLTVEQRFPLSGTLGNRKRAAQAEAQRFRADADRVELDVELDAAKAFLMLQERRQTERILNEQRAFAQQVLRAALARFSAGAGGQAEALRAEIEVSRLGGTLRSTAAEIRAAEAMLNASLARPADAPVPALASASASSAPPPIQSVRETALAHRPELSAGRAEISRAEAEVSVPG